MILFCIAFLALFACRVITCLLILDRAALLLLFILLAGLYPGILNQMILFLVVYSICICRFLVLAKNTYFTCMPCMLGSNALVILSLYSSLSFS